ncbi:hypothetical protein CT676_42795 [Bradyrhizobium sp. MOS001]|nr:hypothetical protein CT676_42795 [Bradyrhizobium sp. MOS001]
MAAMYEFLRALTALSGGFLGRWCRYPHCRSPHPRCHSPRRRGNQYAAASRLDHWRLGVLGRPVEPGDDTERAATPPPATLAPPSSARSRTSAAVRTGSGH